MKKLSIKISLMKEKKSFKKKIDLFRHQAGAAKRYFDDMMGSHKIPGTYSYATDTPDSSGLTMEEMLAAAWVARADEEKFEEKQSNQVTRNFISLVVQVYNMRRGYNIDDGDDKPEEYKFVSNEDKARCAGGGVNSLASALASVHKDYEVKKIVRDDVERAIRVVYEEIIERNPKLIDPERDKKLLRVWSSTNKITGELRDKLKEKFQADYFDEFKEDYFGYIPNGTFNNIVEKALDNIKIPEKYHQEFSIENMASNEVVAAIKADALPLMIFDQEQGKHLITLQYLMDKVAGLKMELRRELGPETLNFDEPDGRKLALFVSRSRIEGLEDMVLLYIKDKPLSLKDIQSLSDKELEILNSGKDIVKKCVARKSCKLKFTDFIRAKRGACLNKK